MKPTEAINALEVAFRELIRLVWGDEWITKSKLDVSALEHKLHEEQAKRRGVVLSTDLLDYTEFTQLGNVLMANWGDFGPALGKKKYAETYIDRLNGLRNPTMHSRALLPFERKLLSGIVGEFLNLVAIYRSQRGPDMQLYPVIDSVLDSFGNECLLNRVVTTNLRLKVGDKVTFACLGTDPQGRALRWSLTIFRSGSAKEPYDDKVESDGGNATLTWTINEKHVAEEVTAMVNMASSGKYHRDGNDDDRRLFIYAVDPPN
jgi:hypothetical protein